LFLNSCSFDKAGVVALGPKNQLVISLDRCDAIEQKYFVIGEIDDQDVETLVNIGLYETDANHNPFTPLQILCAKILQNKTPGYVSFSAFRTSTELRAVL
jgi:hypothetical protein